ncbi:MAG: 2-oxoglutarate dehydrogenase E1 component [Legionellales bacterium]|nr:2-oxoglutarate dehydrogenase E1 component [Legionellales bacterium]
MQSDIMAMLTESLPFSSNNEDFITQLYEAFLEDESQVDPSWYPLFRAMEETLADYSSLPMTTLEAELRSRQINRQATVSSQSISSDQLQKYLAVQAYINTVYQDGHLDANINPLIPKPNEAKTVLSPPVGCHDEHQLHPFDWQGQPCMMTLAEIQSRLNQAYGGMIGFEWSHVDSEEERKWLQHNIERLVDVQEDDNERLAIFREVYATEASDDYLGIRYVGQKRFSLKGAESLVPAINMAIRQASTYDCDEVVIGMAHRGRLSVMLNVCGMPINELCQEFDNADIGHGRSGDVKYHMGYSRDRMFGDNCVHVSLCFNPSHLEFICPVAMGSVRARLDAQEKGQTNFKNSMAILVHGDASFMGQGVVSECLNMSYTDAYNIKGSVHIVVNNQVGFTAKPTESRSTRYATDVTKMIAAPVFHVNGDDPIAVVKATKLAIDYRCRFNKDVVIDIVCYRRFGHNETDDPSITDPMFYKEIKQHPTVKELLERNITHQSPSARQAISQIKQEIDKNIKSGSGLIDVMLTDKIMHYRNMWKAFTGSPYAFRVDTTFSRQRLINLAETINQVPNDYQLNRTVKVLLDQRDKMIETTTDVNWGMAEMLAYASLLVQGFGVRLVGQDTQRGTFSHRHAVVYDIKTGESCLPLKQLESRGVHVDIYNSVLSEQAALGFEYGYANTDPYTLVIWEAQFGDFSNGAQVIIDQFISSAWQKWMRLSGIVLMLPHGYEGQGPEHSSARLERYLQLCAQNNMQVCMPTTPAQIYHLIRKQMLQKTRIPLVIMSPKSLLRHPKAVSDFETLATGEFSAVINETNPSILASRVKRVILTSGKVFYDLAKLRDEYKINDIVIIRLEQLFPTPTDQLKDALAYWHVVSDVVWCQEEPQNQGSWYVKRKSLEECLQGDQTLTYVGRPKSASPATGYLKKHKQETQVFLHKALMIEYTLED